MKPLRVRRNTDIPLHAGPRARAPSTALYQEKVVSSPTRMA